MEQFKLGLRFVDMKIKTARGEFVGMVSLEEMNAEAISNAILQVLEELGLNLKTLAGQGYDGCSSMSGCISGVQARIRKQQLPALYFHWASHHLDLVVNKANLVPKVRNAVASVKAAIKFSRGSSLRRKHAPALPLLRHTRWSSKYKSVRLLHQNFVSVMEALGKLLSSMRSIQYTITTR